MAGEEQSQIKAGVMSWKHAAPSGMLLVVWCSSTQGALLCKDLDAVCNSHLVPALLKFVESSQSTMNQML